MALADAAMNAVLADMRRVLDGNRAAALRQLSKEQQRTILPVMRSYDKAFRWTGGDSSVPFVRSNDFQQQAPMLSASQRLFIQNALRARGSDLELDEPVWNARKRVMGLPGDVPVSVAMHELAHAGNKTPPKKLDEYLPERAFTETGSMVAENNYSGLSSRMGPSWQYRYMRQYGPRYTGNFNTDVQETLRFSDRWHDPKSTLHKMAQQWLKSPKPLRTYDQERRLTGNAPTGTGSPMSRAQFEQQFPAMKSLRMTVQKRLPKKSEAISMSHTEIFRKMVGLSL